MSSQDVNPPTHDNRRQASHALNAQEKVKPGTPISSQSRVDHGSSIGESDGPNVTDM